MRFAGANSYRELLVSVNAENAVAKVPLRCHGPANHGFNAITDPMAE